MLFTFSFKFLYLLFWIYFDKYQVPSTSSKDVNLGVLIGIFQIKQHILKFGYLGMGNCDLSFTP